MDCVVWSFRAYYRTFEFLKLHTLTPTHFFCYWRIHLLRTIGRVRRSIASLEPTQSHSIDWLAQFVKLPGSLEKDGVLGGRKRKRGGRTSIGGERDLST